MNSRKFTSLRAPTPRPSHRPLAELQHASEHDAARRILRVDREGGLKSAHGLIPGAAPISGERCPIRRAQLALLLGEIALAAEQLEDVLGLGLAADQHGVDLA